MLSFFYCMKRTKKRLLTRAKSGRGEDNFKANVQQNLMYCGVQTTKKALIIHTRNNNKKKQVDQKEMIDFCHCNLFVYRQ